MRTDDLLVYIKNKTPKTQSSISIQKISLEADWWIEVYYQRRQNMHNSIKRNGRTIQRIPKKKIALPGPNAVALRQRCHNRAMTDFLNNQQPTVAQRDSMDRLLFYIHYPENKDAVEIIADFNNNFPGVNLGAFQQMLKAELDAEIAAVIEPILPSRKFCYFNKIKQREENH
eukprot:TRINITY_DN18695_c0_g1_i1.p2 TRINITY_DN18695_c0_g1~~TRINITY_DN18695_c0_g1_i1.p2  ORF type:complete len:195 (+),score=2.52 TRINITY_DN18695_c0_g1_i1:72-587(+)